MCDRESIIGLERDGRVEAGQRFLPPAEVHQGKSSIVVGCGNIRLKADRQSHLPFRRFEFVLLQENQAQQIESFEVVRICLQDRAIRVLRLGDLTSRI